MIFRFLPPFLKWIYKRYYIYLYKCIGWIVDFINNTMLKEMINYHAGNNTKFKQK